MGVTSPVHTARGNSCNKPPVIIFVLCLLFFATATLAMAMFIKHSDNILNPEIKENWHKFLSTLGEKDLCVTMSEAQTTAEMKTVSQLLDGGPVNSTRHEEGEQEDEELETVVSVSVQATVKSIQELSKVPRGMVAVSGTINMGGWPRLCYEGDPGDNPLTVSFFMPRTSTPGVEDQVCVILTGSPVYLPLSRRSSSCVPATVDPTKTVIGSVTAVGGACVNGTALKLQYDADPTIVERYYLSQHERWAIYTRLLHVTYMLMGVTMAFLAYLFIPVRRFTTPPSDKVRLTLSQVSLSSTNTL